MDDVIREVNARMLDMGLNWVNFNNRDRKINWLLLVDDI